MQISGTGIDTFTAWIKPDFKPRTQLALKWVKLASGNYVAVDRGAAQDVYQAKFRIYGTEAKVDEFIQEIEDARVATNHTVTMSAFRSTEHVFGVDVNHGGSITATVLEISDRKQGTWKGFSIQIMAQAIGPSFSGSATLPTLKYLRPGYVGDSSVPVNKMDSYDGTFTYVDDNSGAGHFTGVFQFSSADMQKLRRYIATERGDTVSIPAIAGVTNPFGVRRNDSGYPYSAKILEWEDLGMVDVGHWAMKLTLAEVA